MDNSLSRIEPDHLADNKISEKNLKGSKDSKNKDQQQTDEEQEAVGFMDLFRFADKYDYALMTIGSISALAIGCALPAFSLLWGNMTDSFAKGGDAMVDASKKSMIEFVYIGIATFVGGWLMFATWMISGERQAITCRKEYLKSLLRQEIGWFDTIDQSALSSKFATDCFAFQGAIGEKVSTILMTIGMFVCGFIIAFVKGWLMSLVVLSSIPAIGISGYFYITVIQNKDKKQSKSYSKAGAKAEEALAAIKTVKFLNGIDHEIEKYTASLSQSSSKLIKYAVYSGMGIGGIFGVLLCSYALGFWFGSHCVQGSQRCPASLTSVKYEAGTVLVIFFSILMAGFNLSQLTPSLKKIAEGRQAAARIFRIIDRTPLICSPPNGGIRPPNFKGCFELHNVTFAYPKNKSLKILDNVSIKLDGSRNGLVGESGCGKSTIMQLIMRFYDPDSGAITLDGVDLKEIDLDWLRAQIGYVGQEPVLFATSIKQNLLFGRGDATQDEIIKALKQAEAYDFIQTLDQKEETYVGYGGGQLSGGQKQRIAIARALLRNPKILLLDQATSALDRRNQKLIQSTLERVSEGRVSITIAHRVKTIVNCDKIVVMKHGSVEESGCFKDLKRYAGIHFEDEPADEFVVAEEKPDKRRKESAKGIINLIEQDQSKSKEELTKEQREKKQQQQLIAKYDKDIFTRVFSYARDKKAYFIFGIILALLNGAIFPVFSIFLSDMLDTLVSFGTNPGESRAKADKNALAFFLLGIAAFITNTLQITFFSIVGEEITQKMRQQTFGKVLKMSIPWHDEPKHNAGTLSARLASDCQAVNGLATTYVGITIQNLSTLLCGIIIAFAKEWHITLVSLGMIPLMIMAGVIQMAFNTGFSDKTDAAYKDSSNLIMEAMVNIRTVSSFGYQNSIYQKYEGKLVKPRELAVQRGNISGVLFGLSQIILFLVFGLIFYIGSIFVRDVPGVTVNTLFTAIYAIVFSAMTAGNNSHFMPDIAAARNSAANLFVILDSQDEFQRQEREKSKRLQQGITGGIQFNQVSFKYSSRNTPVFTKLDLSIRRGTKNAFVGASGCGKSTILQLLLRFYDTDEGTILIDGTDIKEYDLNYLRKCFGVVSQQPTLFNGTFRSNIRYNMEAATEDDIYEAAKQANALTFILGEEALQMEVRHLEKPKNDKTQQQNDDMEKEEEENGTGFGKNVGIKGSHISGGQKQRVAIARTILRRPMILLLDEATSALDSKNEAKVQQSLDRIMQGKTSLTVAHRIETIRNSDCIYVFQLGKIVESGSYSELIAKKGYFHALERGTRFV